MRMLAGYLLGAAGAFFLFCAFLGVALQVGGGHPSPKYGIHGLLVGVGAVCLWVGACVYKKWPRAYGVWAVLLSLMMFASRSDLVQFAALESGREAVQSEVSRIVLGAAIILLIGGILLIIPKGDSPPPLGSGSGGK